MAQIGYGTKVAIGRGATPTFTELEEIKDVTLPANQADQLEATTMQSPGRRKQFIAGLIDSGEATIETNWVPNSPTDVLLRSIADSGEAVQIRYTVPAPTTANANVTFVETWSGFCSNLERTAPVGEIATCTATFKISGKVV